ncbi:hypothetical protein BaRGS_00018315 [Batillaria attramentaria]|uniref:Uncharacterized protein n=1 Tax=Batillaria attramentaria TaxID=370345 RepID=A0ABD0KTM6_9CAEN
MDIRGNIRQRHAMECCYDHQGKKRTGVFTSRSVQLAASDPRGVPSACFGTVRHQQLTVHWLALYGRSRLHGGLITRCRHRAV